MITNRGKRKKNPTFKLSSVDEQSWIHLQNKKDFDGEIPFLRKILCHDNDYKLVWKKENTPLKVMFPKFEGIQMGLSMISSKGIITNLMSSAS